MRVCVFSAHLFLASVAKVGKKTRIIYTRERGGLAADFGIGSECSKGDVSRG